MNSIKAYIDEVLKEMRKVNWPKRQELIANTGITLIGTFIFGAFFWGADRLIAFLLDLLYI